MIELVENGEYIWLYKVHCTVLLFFFFKQKTAYEIKECDWSSDVCSSDLRDVNNDGAKITYISGNDTLHKSFSSDNNGFNNNEIGRASCRERV